MGKLEAAYHKLRESDIGTLFRRNGAIPLCFQGDIHMIETFPPEPVMDRRESGLVVPSFEVRGLIESDLDDRRGLFLGRLTSPDPELVPPELKFEFQWLRGDQYVGKSINCSKNVVDCLVRRKLPPNISHSRRTPLLEAEAYQPLQLIRL